jgi:cell division protein ZapA
MAEVQLSIGGHSYSVACADGEEAHLQRLAGLVDAEVSAARAAAGALSESWQLLFAALFLADKLPAADGAELARRIDALSDRIESLAATVARG